MPPAPSLHPRDRAVLLHLARYRAGLLSVMARRFFKGRVDSTSRSLGILAKRGLIKAFSRQLQQSVSYYQLTAQGFAALGRTANKRSVDALGSQALDAAIGLNVFCHLGSERRHRLWRDELVPMFGDGTPPANVFHVISQETGWECLFRAVFVASVDRHLAERFSRHIKEARKNLAIRPWLEAGDYGFALLVPWADKVDAVRELVDGVAKDFVTIVDVAPTAQTLASFLSSLPKVETITPDKISPGVKGV